jgi:hypothetical protein
MSWPVGMMPSDKAGRITQRWFHRRLSPVHLLKQAAFERGGTLNTNRAEAFSDGVFAIAAVLLVLGSG